MNTGDLFETEPLQGATARDIDLPDAELAYLESFLAPQEARDAFAALMSPGAVNWRQDYIQMYGRQVAVPRLNAWYGDAGLHYAYSGIPLVLNHGQSVWQACVRRSNRQRQRVLPQC